MLDVVLNNGPEGHLSYVSKPWRILYRTVYGVTQVDDKKLSS